MLCYESLGNQIVIRGRDENSNRYEKTIDCKPYFYITDKKGEYTSLYDDKLIRIECDDQYDLYAKRKKYNSTFESDVPHEIRYLIDNYTEIDKEPIRICFFDIETEDRDGFPDVKKADKPILSIAFYDNFTDKYTILITSPTKSELIKECEFDVDDEIITVNYIECKTESQMLKTFMDLINVLDFDIFYAWNGGTKNWQHEGGFDYPMLFNRIKRLKLPLETISPIKSIDKRSTFPNGRAFLDLMKAHRKLSTQELESYALDAVGDAELGIRKVYHEERIGDMWEHDLNKFSKYNLKDVYIMVKIEQNKGITDYFDTIRRTTFCKWDDLLWNSKVLDTYALKYAKKLNVVLPDKKRGNDTDESIQGARVLTPVVGVHKGCAVVDIQSMYPSAILTCNMSPETIIDEYYAKENNIKYCKVDDICFRTDVRGFVPLLVEELWDLRTSYKKERNKYSHNSEEYARFDSLQTVCKFLINSLYGVLLLKIFRLYDRNVGKSVTFFGRNYNEFMEQYIIDSRHKPIYGDSVTKNTKIDIVGKGKVDIQDLFTHVDYEKNGKEYCNLKDVYTPTLNDNLEYVCKKVPYIVRHKTNKHIYNLNISDYNINVNVTEDHSLIGYDILDGNLFKIKPLDAVKDSTFLIRNIINGNLQFHSKYTINEIEYDDYVYDIEVEDTHRFFGNGILLSNTDSICFKLHESTYNKRIKEAEKITKELNDLSDKWCIDNWGDSKYNHMHLEFESIYQSLITLPARDGTEAKKRYFGLVYYKDGDDLRNDPELCIKGISAKRSDTPNLLRSFQKDIFKMVLLGREDEAKTLVKQMYFDITNNKYTPEELAIPKGMSKAIDEYDGTLPIHIRGAKYFNNYCGGNIKRDKIKYIYVQPSIHPKGAPQTNVISFVDKFPSDFKPDFITMADKLLIYQYDTLFKVMKWDIDELKGQCSLAAWM